METLIRSLKQLPTEQWHEAGGKAGTLARLAQAGYPVPDGFVILSAAFADDELLPGAWQQVQAHLEHMRASHPDITFAVRSSALHEDSAQASFAGAFETVLDVRTDQAVRDAIHTVRTSRHNARVQAYSQTHHMEAANDLAVVVQRMIRAEVSGVLFTADPVTGSRTRIIGNSVHGTGEQLVSGEANPDTLVLQRPKGDYAGPPEFKPLASRLYRLACRLEKELECPQDIEWAIAGGQVYLLQSRPITTLQAYNPATGEWNDSLTGDYLWTSTNFAEALPSVMTPSTWSLMQIFHFETFPAAVPGKWPWAGNICGRTYVNVTLIVSAFCASGMPFPDALRRVEETLGHLPEDVHIEVIPLLTLSDFLTLLPANLKLELMMRNEIKKIPAFLAETPAWCEHMHQRIRSTQTRADLLSLWREELKPYVKHAFYALRGSMRRFDERAARLRRELKQLVGDADANALLSHVSSDGELLASLGPIVGLASVALGTMSREVYQKRYGHRGPDEFELARPRPAEDPHWLERQLADWARSPVNVEALLAKQHDAFDAARQRFQERYPRKAKAIHRRLEQFTSDARMREAVRSETTRVVGVVRQFALHAGELTGLGNDIFFLSLDEMLDILEGLPSAAEYIPARRETHARYSALPRYPVTIHGRFDPFQWAANPNRRTDLFDAHAPLPTLASDIIVGFAGAAGHLEGRVRCLNTPEEGDQLQPGEVLVAVTTNIGWTPLFPRAAAIITDVGAPLSHAAIVARELGIPAVVGCGSATMRLHTGDRVLVDGGQGMVKILERVGQARYKMG